MKQVWFCGMHTDVGGGYKDQQLSDIALTWMLNMAQTHGLLIYPKHKVQINPDPNGYMHDSRGGKLTKYYRCESRSWPISHGIPTIHSSVLERTLNQYNKPDPPYHPWILNHYYDVEL